MELSGKLTNKISLSGKLARNSSLSGTILRSTGGSGGAVNSVNGQTGDVVLDAQDVGALPASTAIPSKTSDITNDSGFVNASGAAAAAPVQSVNGQTGDVTVQSATDAQVAEAVDDWLTAQAPSIGTLSYAAKQALLACFRKVAWIDDQGQSYYNALERELFPSATLESITAVFTQGSAVIYDTDSLDTLKQYLTVTANYSDSTTATVTDYTLSGTLTAGTSTITVSYGGKTDTFTVAVSIGLDSVAYGTMTYREIFVTNNKVLIGDFETAMTEDANFHAVGDYQYKVKAAGAPTRSTAAYNSYNHSLKAFGTTSQQMIYKSSDSETLTLGSQYLVCAAVKVDRYVQGNAGVQMISPISNSVDRANAILTRTTSGFEPVVAILTMTATRTGWLIYIGNYSSANLDCYVDDVVVTPLPSGMTQAEAETLYANYLEIVGRAS